VIQKAKKQPTFASNKELARWVDEVHLGNGGRVSSAAFLPIDGEKYLSVNSLEIESTSQIADYYRSKFLRGSGNVYVSCLKVIDYTAAAKEAGVRIRFDRLKSSWLFEHNGNYQDAYLLRANHLSASHCGVETIVSMRDDTPNKFARRLAGKPPRKNPHVF
jgi:hypothetical protein